MWSGPRNISTALMRSWGNRPDTAVCDEPLYAHYLLATGVPHPGADEVIRCHETDWRKVVAGLVSDVPDGKPIYYQKHMAHHLLPEIDRLWLDQVTNVFLIRGPGDVIASFARVVAQPQLADTGLPQQLEIFKHVRRRTGRLPVVIDARDILLDPPRMLGLLCEAVGVPFSEMMLAWPPGPRPTDGVWAKHWYHAVWNSTSFHPYKPRNEPVPPELQGLLADAEPIYRQLAAYRLR